MGFVHSRDPESCSEDFRLKFLASRIDKPANTLDAVVADPSLRRYFKALVEGGYGGVYSKEDAADGADEYMAQNYTMMICLPPKTNRGAKRFRDE
jgi:hypothetical protein